MSLDTTRSRLGAYGGSPGLCHILKNFIPRLLSRGFTEEHIRLFFVENPAKAFARKWPPGMPQAPGAELPA
ncbi:MAG: hypothetical protein LBQ44_02335 [Treponema sp.]|jgi:predicted metal-dependent phosphotriesterase family hydrolase|nr:hypothetical protein [Treponema sp.]